MNNALNNITEGFVSLDKNLCFTQINKMAGKFLDRDPGSLLGKHVLAEFPDGLGLPFYKAYTKAVQTQKAQRLEAYYEPLDTWFEHRVYPSPDEVTIFFADITEKRKAQDSLLHKEQELSILYSTLTQPVFMLKIEPGVTYKFISVNKSFLTALGITENNVINKDLRDLVKEPLLSLVLKKYNSAVRSKKTVCWEETTPYKMGIKTAQVSISPLLDQGGNCTHLIGTILDITEHKKFEEELKVVKDFSEKIIHSMVIGLLVISPERKIIKVNQAFCEMTGYTESELLASKYPFPFWIPEKIKVYEEKFNLFVKNKLNFRWESTFQRKNGEHFPVSNLASKVLDASGKPVAFFAMVSDISENTRLEKALIENKTLLNLSSELANMAAWEFDFETNSMSRSENHDRLYGLEKQGLWKLETFLNATHPNDRELSNSKIQKSIAPGGPDTYKFDFRVIHPDKSVHWLNVIGEVLRRNKKGEGTLVRGFIIEITDRKLAEERLIKSEKYLDNIIDNIGDPVFVKDDQSRLLLVNNAFCKMFNLSKADLIGTTIAEEVQPEEFEMFFKIDEQVLSTGIENINEELFTARGQETRTILTRKTRFVDENGDKFLIGVTSDITDRKQAELKLNRANEFSEGLIASMHEGLVVFDQHTEIIHVNPSFCKMSGFTEKELIGKSCPYPFSPPEIEEEAIIRHDKLSRGAVIDEFDSVYMRKNGIRFNVHVMVSSIKDVHGNLIAYFGTVNDTTERIKAELKLMESEANLKQSQFAANIGSFVLDLNTMTWTSTDVLDHILGIKKSFVKDFNGWVGIVHPEDQEPMKDYFWNTILKLKKPEKYNKEYRIVKGNNKETRWVQVFGELVFDGQGNPIKVVGTAQDITERKITERQIILANEQLSKANMDLNVLRKHLEQENKYLKKELDLVFNYEDMVYGSTEFSNVLSDIEKVAPTNATVLLLGESGTGKELLARAVHNTSLRNANALIKVNCSAIPRELLESELFGHKKGSFTGAVSDKMGKFELADKGTLFLDEIGELPLDMQPKILRFLQDGEIEVVGGTGMKKLNVRVIAATNRNLKKEVEEKRFREDLFFRLNVFPIEVPPLRNRKDDIPLLVEHFIDKFNKKYSKNIKYIADSAMEKLRSYNWPGNIRELENLIERAAIFAHSDTLWIPGFETEGQKAKQRIAEKNLSLDAVQRQHILQVLEQCHWKITGANGASALLNLKPSTLRDKISKLGIKKPMK